MTSMASMAFDGFDGVDGRHKGALTWKSPWCLVASSGDEWRRMAAGALTQTVR